MRPTSKINSSIDLYSTERLQAHRSSLFEATMGTICNDHCALAGSQALDCILCCWIHYRLPKGRGCHDDVVAVSGLRAH